MTEGKLEGLPESVTATPVGAATGTQPSAALDICAGCYKTADVEPVKVKRDGQWVDSTVRRCTNPECHSVREGTLEDRVAHINSVYGYKYFGDYELDPHQMDMVGEAVMLANRVPPLCAALSELLEACEADCGIPDEDDEDDEPVGGGDHGPMALTFGMLRRARAALAKAEGR